ncbi:Interferon omega-1 [Tupaia chinensis]|uniref:Interferon omega-1 n=1 Tax=Tupaia chinensis TaxID=246437 RepID=L8YCP0_TUPCH|nr:Interferon omega-1 [Tupaia chinensis]
MALLLPLLPALVLCSFGPLGSLGCDLPQNPGQLSRKTLVLLGQMRRISLVLCLKDRRDFGFPRHVVEGRQLQEAQAVSVLHEMLQQTFNLFVSEASSAAWNTTLLDQLHSGLELEDLEDGLVQGVVEEPSALAPESPPLALEGVLPGPPALPEGELQ